MKNGNGQTKLVSLALQGGGAHGAFGWGVLDYLAEDGRLSIEGLSATSAGSMNAVVYAQGRMQGGNDGARAALEAFWRRISDAGRLYSPLKHSPLEKSLESLGLSNGYPASYALFESVTRALSPYQFNPFNFNPLRDVLAASVDLDAITRCNCVELFICATNVRTGHARIFRNHEVTLNVVLASACLPFLFQAVEVDGHHYWDGGYMGNPALYPLFYETKCRDVIIVHINPMVRENLPKTAQEIQDRLNEITFNSSLVRELRAVAFVTKLIEQGWLKDEYAERLKHVLIHSVRADEALKDLSIASKFNTDWAFLCDLRDRGREAARQWMAKNYDSIGKQSSVDLRREYLGEPASAPAAPARARH